MPEFPISTLAAVIESLPVPVVLVSETGAVVASSPATHAIVGALPTGKIFAELVGQLAVPPMTTHHPVQTDGEPHVLVAFNHDVPAPADVAALARETAHDFNNLLGVIINFASLAAAQLPEGSGAAQDLQEVLVASRRAATLTQRLLQIATAAPDHQVE